MSKENKLLTAFTTFMLEHGIECEEDIYQNDTVDEDSLSLIEDLFNIVDIHKTDIYKTNADRIRNMSDVELAELIPCPYMKGQYDECIHGWQSYDCIKCTLDWLQLEAE